MALMVAALADMWRRPVEEINGDRRLWTLASFINFAGPLAYFVFGRKRCCEVDSGKLAPPAAPPAVSQ